MRQVSEACTGIGAGTESGYVDFNYCYTDYENINYEFKQKFDIKDFNKKKLDTLLMTLGASACGLLIAVVGGKTIVYKKKQKQNKKKGNNRKRRI